MSNEQKLAITLLDGGYQLYRPLIDFAAILVLFGLIQIFLLTIIAFKRSYGN